MFLEFDEKISLFFIVILGKPDRFSSDEVDMSAEFCMMEVMYGQNWTNNLHCLLSCSGSVIPGKSCPSCFGDTESLFF